MLEYDILVAIGIKLYLMLWLTCTIESKFHNECIKFNGTIDAGTLSQGMHGSLHKK